MRQWGWTEVVEWVAAARPWLMGPTSEMGEEVGMRGVLHGHSLRLRLLLVVVLTPQVMVMMTLTIMPCTTTSTLDRLPALPARDGTEESMATRRMAHGSPTGGGGRGGAAGRWKEGWWEEGWWEEG